HTNQTLVDNSVRSMFVTMFLAHYEPATGRFRYVCAGHPPPLILSARNPEPLGPPTAPLLGVFDNSHACAAIEQAEHVLQPGETLLLYTDGVTEARSPDGLMLGDEGLIQACRGIASDDARGLCERLIAGLHAYEHGGQADDITVLALRRAR